MVQASRVYPPGCMLTAGVKGEEFVDKGLKKKKNLLF